MLVRRRETLSLALVCLFLTSAALAGATDTATKVDRAKQVDRDGYVPTVLGRSVQVAETEPNDTLEQAESIAVGAVIEATVPDGDVDWFLVDATAEAYVTIATSAIDGSVTDTVLDVFDVDGTVLLASDDDGGDGLYSAAQSVAAESVLAVRVTRFSASGGDSYGLTVEAAGPPPAAPSNDAPASAEVLEDCSTLVSGTTVGATSTVGAGGCVQPDPLGGEVFYRLTLDYGYQLTVQVEPGASFDPAAYLFTDPSDPEGSCVVGVDEAFAGEQETLLFTNDDPAREPIVLYLAIDGWDPSRPGSFQASLACDFVVSNDGLSFGAVKARF